MHEKFKALATADKKLLYKQPLVQAEIVQRPNRYIAIVKLASGAVVRAHTPVGGRIGGLTIDGLPCLLSGPYEGRATVYTVEAIGLHTSKAEPNWVGINQTAANSYIKEFLLAGLLPELAPTLALGTNGVLHPERKLEDSRIDFFVDADEPAQELWIEVKTPLIKLHTAIPSSIPLKTDYSSNSVGNRMPKQMQTLFKQLSLGRRVALAAVFIYNHQVKSSDQLRLKENLNLDGLLTEGRKLGLESWQINLAIDEFGVKLNDYGRLL